MGGPGAREESAGRAGGRGRRGGWEGGVGGEGGRNGSAGRQAARAREKPVVPPPSVCVHTAKTRPRHPPDPTCRPIAGERVWWDCIGVPPPAGAMAANNWSRMRTDLGACMSSSHVEPVLSSAVPARQNLKRAGGTSRRDPTTA